MATQILGTIPTTKLSTAGRIFLEDLLARSAGWKIAIEQIGGEWFLIDSSSDETLAITPIEIFNLEDGALL